MLVIIAGFLAAIGIGTYNYIRTNRFRQNAKENDICKIYVDDVKCPGKITSRIGDLIELSFWDDEDCIHKTSAHISNIYPAW